jgi:hypothetical protein
MKVGELKQALEHVDDGDEVVVLVSRSAPGIGARPSVSVSSATGGFDWERGRLNIGTDQSVYAGKEGFEKAARFAHRVRNILYMMKMDKTRQKNGNAIKLIIEALDRWLPDRAEKKS